MKYWMSMLFTGSSPQPATDHWLFTSTPTTQCPCIVNATAAGPKLNLPLPRSLSVAVGNVNVGPTPQISSPGFAGDKKNVGLMSPSPVALPSPGASDGRLITGMMIRVIRFQFSVRLIGITG